MPGILPSAPDGTGYNGPTCEGSSNLDGSSAWIECKYGQSPTLAVSVESYPTPELADKRFDSLNGGSRTTTSRIEQWHRASGTGRLIVTTNSYKQGSGWTDSFVR
jgi:hypothetical protein